MTNKQVNYDAKIGQAVSLKYENYVKTWEEGEQKIVPAIIIPHKMYI